MPKTSRIKSGSARGHAVSVLLSAMVIISACSSTDGTADISELEGRLADLELVVENLTRQLTNLEVAPAIETEDDSSDSNDSTPSSPSTDSGEGTRNNPVPVGVTAEVGEGWTLRINNVEFDAQGYEVWNPFNDPPADGYAYVVINITTGYTGPEAKSSDGVRISAVGDSNVEISNDTFVVPPEPQYESFIDVFASGENSGNIVLEVPIDDIDSVVLYAEAFMSFDSSEVFFALR